MAKMPRWALILHYSLIVTIFVGWAVGFAGWLLQIQWLCNFGIGSGAAAFVTCWLLNFGFNVRNRVTSGSES